MNAIVSADTHLQKQQSSTSKLHEATFFFVSTSYTTRDFNTSSIARACLPFGLTYGIALDMVGMFRWVCGCWSSINTCEEDSWSDWSPLFTHVMNFPCMELCASSLLIETPNSFRSTSCSTSTGPTLIILELFILRC